MLYSQKSIVGLVRVEVGNARYKIEDHADAFSDRYQVFFKFWSVLNSIKEN